MDIARRAGVSQSTVSVVINGAPAIADVSDEKRRAVLEAAAELGYSVNASARNLKGGRNRMLGVFTFEPVFPVNQRDFYFPFLLGIEESTAECGYNLLLFSAVTAGAERRVFADGVNQLKLADGCVLLGRHLREDDLAALLREDFPFVFIGRRDVPGEEFSYVAADYVGATRDVVLSLAALGHRRIAYLKAADDKEWTQDRETGFRQGLDEAGIADEQILFHVMGEDATLTGADLRRWRTAGVTAVLVEPSQDDSAIAAVELASTEAGIEIPGDLSVVLLGDPPLVQATERDWTRFTIPREQMGREAVRLLLELLDDEDGAKRHVYLDCIPVPGDSVAEPRRDAGGAT